jgi:hypothetical protein
MEMTPESELDQYYDWIDAYDAMMGDICPYGNTPGECASEGITPRGGYVAVSGLPVDGDSPPVSVVTSLEHPVDDICPQLSTVP